jgi:hypothetical protein
LIPDEYTGDLFHHEQGEVSLQSLVVDIGFQEKGLMTPTMLADAISLIQKIQQA